MSGEVEDDWPDKAFEEALRDVTSDAREGVQVTIFVLADVDT